MPRDLPSSLTPDPSINTDTGDKAARAELVKRLAAVPQSLHFRLADPSDVTTLFEIRQASIRQLSLTHLSEREAAAWAESGGYPRVEQAMSKDDVWVAAFGLQILGWLHRAANSIEGLYVSPLAARQGVGTALVGFAETRIAQEGHHFVVLEASLNAMGFYTHLGYTPATTHCSSAAVPMRKQVTGERPDELFHRTAAAERHR